MQIVFKRTIYTVAAMALLLSGARIAHAQCSPIARATAEKFLRVTSEGAFIGSSVEAFHESLDLTMDDGFPPSSPLIIISGYSIVHESAVKGACRFAVDFHDEGIINSSDILRRKVQQERVNLWIVCTAENACKVDMSDERYGLPPHVTREAVLKWLKKIRIGNRAAKARLIEKQLASW